MRAIELSKPARPPLSKCVSADTIESAKCNKYINEWQLERQKTEALRPTAQPNSRPLKVVSHIESPDLPVDKHRAMNAKTLAVDEKTDPANFSATPINKFVENRYVDETFDALQSL